MRIDVDPLLVVGIPALLLGSVLVAALVVARSVRVASERSAARVAESQAEALRWVTSRLTELDRQLVEAQSRAAETTQRTMSEQLQTMATTINAQLASSQQTLGEGLAGATDVFGRLQGRLGRVAEMATRMEQLAGDVKELGDILRVPKLRGLMGEQTLEAMLRQVLPDRFWTPQHRFSDGRTVDAVVHLGERLLPVDAKFPLESFRRMSEDGEEARRGARRDFVRAVKLRVDEIADRYIRPGEGTVDFALMFVPAEGVYSEVVSGGGDGVETLLDYALARRVLPVSPTTVFAYVSVVASGLRGFEVEARAQEIVNSLAAVDQELVRFKEEFAVLGKHLHNAAQRFTEAERRLDRLETRLERVGVES